MRVQYGVVEINVTLCIDVKRIRGFDRRILDRHASRLSCDRNGLPRHGRAVCQHVGLRLQVQRLVNLHVTAAHVNLAGCRHGQIRRQQLIGLTRFGQIHIAFRGDQHNIGALRVQYGVVEINIALCIDIKRIRSGDRRTFGRYGRFGCTERHGAAFELRAAHVHLGSFQIKVAGDGSKSTVLRVQLTGGRQRQVAFVNLNVAIDREIALRSDAHALVGRH